MKRFSFVLFLLAGHMATPAWTQGTGASADALAEVRKRQEVIASQTGLKAMHANLRGASDLEFTTTFSIVDHLTGTSRSGTAKYTLRQPNKLHITVTSGKKRVIIVSDGTLLTIHEPNKRKYRQVPATDTIVSSIYLVAGLEVIQPRVIDFLWSIDYITTFGGFPTITNTESRKIGPQTCDGVRLIYNEDQWDVWLERSARRYPCRLVSKRRDQSAFTSQTNTFVWHEKRQIAEAEFEFTPPEGHILEN